jgi:4-amino-4-deoxy-L-arabinose transferase-like glycosyltransferase
VAGWKILGISDWWPRLMPALFSLINMILAVMLARRFWPGQREVLYTTPVVLVATGFWAVFQSIAGPEMVAVALVMTAFLFLHRIAYRARLAWLGFAILFALGLLTVGVRFAVYVLPPALLAPVWASDSDIAVRKYFGQLFGAILVALALSAPWWWPLLQFGESILPAIGLGWVTPLSMFEQHRGWWWYLYLIPLVLLPWSIWPLPWLRLWLSRTESTDKGIAFAMTFGLPVVVALSLLPMRQPQLLLPLFPVYAMTIAWLLFQEDLKRAGDDGLMGGMMLPAILVGATLAVLPGLPYVDFLPHFLWELSPLVGVAVAAVGIALSFLPQPPMRQRFQFLAVVMMFIVVGASLFASRQFDENYRYDALAPVLQDAEQKGWQLVQVDPYNGEYQLAARLTRPVVQLAAGDVAAWIARNPDTLVIAYSDGWAPTVVSREQAVFETTIGERTVRLWTAAALMR